MHNSHYYYCYYFAVAAALNLISEKFAEEFYLSSNFPPINFLSSLLDKKMTEIFAFNQLEGKMRRGKFLEEGRKMENSLRIMAAKNYYY